MTKTRLWQRPVQNKTDIEALATTNNVSQILFDAGRWSWAFGPLAYYTPGSNLSWQPGKQYPGGGAFWLQGDHDLGGNSLATQHTTTLVVMLWPQGDHNPSGGAAGHQQTTTLVG